MSEHDETDVESETEAAAAPKLSRIERVAVLFMLLGDEDTARLMALLEPDELEKVGGAMCALGEIDQASMQEALSDFANEAAREIVPAQDRAPQVRALLERSIGETKAESMMMRIEPEAQPRCIEMARWLAPSVLVGLIEDEHPQVIAALLLMLDPEPAAQVLTLLNSEVQTAVVERVARSGPISSQAIEMIDSLLTQRIGANFGANALVLGGPRDAASLINLGAGDLKGTLLPAIAQRDSELAAAIEDELFTFEMLFDLDPQAMGRLLRDVDNDALIDALKGTDEDKRMPFFAAMSSRAADGIRDEIEMRGRLSKAEVTVAQRKIVDLAKSLADQGEISIGADDGEFV